MSRSLPIVPLDTQPSAEALLADYRALLHFIHLVPVGLVRATPEGDIDVMNPMAAQLLAPLGFGPDHETLNLFSILDRASPDIRTLVTAFMGDTGVVCENYRIALPDAAQAPEEAPIALGITVLLLSRALHGLMVVITDESAAVRLQRLKASWGGAR